MKHIGLLSDTHGYLDPAVFDYLAPCDEIWHAGDFGNLDLARQLSAFRPLRGVYGNIDGSDVRKEFGEQLRWTCEETEIFMIHIGGYPPSYNPKLKKQLSANPPQLFICGHSHVLKIMYDEKIQCLHMNPGAAGHHGWHTTRTLVRFTIDGRNIRDCQVIELGKRGR
jgi:putative phosphoesterase